MRTIPKRAEHEPATGGLDGTRRDLVGPREPTHEQAGGLGRCAAVEGHQRRRTTRHQDKVGTPAVRLHLRDLDLVDAAVDGLFEAV